MLGGNVRVRQLVVLLLVSRIFTTLTYIPQAGKSTSGLVTLLVNGAGIVAAILLALPAFVVFHKNKGQNVLDLSYTTFGRVGGSAVAGLYTLYFLACTAIAAAKFEYFVTTVLFPQSASAAVLFTVILTGAVIASFGLEGISRSTLVVMAVFVLSLAITVFSVFPIIHTYNYLPMAMGSLDKMVYGLLESLSQTAELAFFMLAASSIKGSFAKGYCAFVTITFAGFMLFYLLVEGSMGIFALSQPFPFYTLASIGEFFSFERQEAIHVSIWIFMGTLNIAIYVWAACVSASYWAGKLKKPVLIAAVGIVAFGLAWLLAGNLKLFADVLFAMRTLIPLAAVVFLVPLLLLVFSKRRAKKPCGK